MKRILSLIALGLLSNSATANTIINFEGTVSAGGTCPIDVVTPGGPSLPKIYLGDFKSSDFTAIGQHTELVKFALRVDPSCKNNSTDQGYVTYHPNYGVDPSGQLFQLVSGVGYSSGMALAIFDGQGNPMNPGAESQAYPLSDTAPTDMNFGARLQTIAANVTEGHVKTSVNYMVEIR